MLSTARLSSLTVPTGRAHDSGRLVRSCRCACRTPRIGVECENASCARGQEPVTARGCSMSTKKTATKTAVATIETADRPEKIRNVALVGHSAAGKTTLVEALLAATGA